MIIYKTCDNFDVYYSELLAFRKRYPLDRFLELKKNIKKNSNKDVGFDLSLLRDFAGDKEYYPYLYLEVYPTVYYEKKYLQTRVGFSIEAPSSNNTTNANASSNAFIAPYHKFPHPSIFAPNQNSPQHHNQPL